MQANAPIWKPVLNLWGSSHLLARRGIPGRLFREVGSRFGAMQNYARGGEKISPELVSRIEGVARYFSDDGVPSVHVVLVGGNNLRRQLRPSESLDFVVDQHKNLLDTLKSIQQCFVVVVGMVPDPESRVVDRLLRRAANRVRSLPADGHAVFVDARKRLSRRSARGTLTVCRGYYRRVVHVICASLRSAVHFLSSLCCCLALLSSFGALICSLFLLLLSTHKTYSWTLNFLHYLPQLLTLPYLDYLPYLTLPYFTLLTLLISIPLLGCTNKCLIETQRDIHLNETGQKALAKAIAGALKAIPRSALGLPPIPAPRPRGVAARLVRVLGARRDEQLRPQTPAAPLPDLPSASIAPTPPLPLPAPILPPAPFLNCSIM